MGKPNTKMGDYLDEKAKGGEHKEDEVGPQEGAGYGGHGAW